MLRHGSLGGWRAGCRQTCCKRAYSRYTSNRYNARTNRGANTEWDDPVAVSKRLELLLTRYGYTYRSISARTKVSKETLARLRTDPYNRKVRKVTAEKVMNVPLKYDDYRPTPQGLISTTGAERRIRAMQYRGFTLKQIHEYSDGVDFKILKLLRDGDKKLLWVSTRDRLDKAYRITLLLPDPQGRHAENTRREAKEKGYLPAGVWRDIDDPDDVPETESDPAFTEVRRRMQALRARGFLLWQMEENSGVSKGNIAKITQGTYTKCKDSTREKLESMCDILEPQPNPEGSEHEEARQRSFGKGWGNLLESR